MSARITEMGELSEGNDLGRVSGGSGLGASAPETINQGRGGGRGQKGLQSELLHFAMRHVILQVPHPLLHI